LGSKKENHGSKESAFREERWTYTCRAKKALAVDEGSLGGAEKSCAQVIYQITGVSGLPIVFASA
jgi:hypothetical protein